MFLSKRPVSMLGATWLHVCEIVSEKVRAHGAYTANLAQPTAVSDHGVLESNADNTLHGCLSVGVTKSWSSRGSQECGAISNKKRSHGSRAW